MSTFKQRASQLGITANAIADLNVVITLGDMVLLSDGNANIIARVTSMSDKLIQVKVFNKGGSSSVIEDQIYDAEVDEVIHIFR